jgi:hypothetical protein
MGNKLVVRIKTKRCNIKDAVHARCKRFAVSLQTNTNVASHGGVIVAEEASKERIFLQNFLILSQRVQG